MEFVTDCVVNVLRKQFSGYQNRPKTEQIVVSNSWWKSVHLKQLFIRQNDKIVFYLRELITLEKIIKFYRRV
jgi:hypothetical protein